MNAFDPVLTCIKSHPMQVFFSQCQALLQSTPGCSVGLVLAHSFSGLVSGRLFGMVLAHSFSVLNLSYLCLGRLWRWLHGKGPCVYLQSLLMYFFCLNFARYANVRILRCAFLFLIWVKVDPSAFLFCDLLWPTNFPFSWPIISPFPFTWFGIKPNAESHSLVQSFWLTRRRMLLCSSVSHYWLTCHTSRVYSSFHYCFHIHFFTRLMLEKSCASHVVT
jgi:hypothetical protein